MIKHTLANLGPAVSAERMFQDYVDAALPARIGGRPRRGGRRFRRGEGTGRLDRPGPQRLGRVHGGARGLDRHRGGTADWRQVPVDAYVRLNSALAPDRASPSRWCTGKSPKTTISRSLPPTSLTVAPTSWATAATCSPAAGVTIDRSGSFGYSVRVSRHPALANQAELGLHSQRHQLIPIRPADAWEGSAGRGRVKACRAGMVKACRAGMERPVGGQRKLVQGKTAGQRHRTLPGRLAARGGCRMTSGRTPIYRRPMTAGRFGGPVWGPVSGVRYRCPVA